MLFSDNRNPKIKEICLEILKMHIDTLPPDFKQVFIKNILLENLERARDIKNNIPYEVLVKCFEFLIIFINDLPETLLYSILQKYTKPTTDERLISIILKVTKYNF